MARASLFRLGFYALAVALSGPAGAVEPLQLRAETEDGHLRVRFIWPEYRREDPPKIETEVVNTVTIVRFAEAVSLDTAQLTEDNPFIALARLDADGRVLRLALRQPLDAVAQSSGNEAGLDLVDPEAGVEPKPFFSLIEEAERAAQAKARAEAEAAARARAAAEAAKTDEEREAEARAKAEAEASARAKAEAEARARLDAAERLARTPAPLKVAASETADYTRIQFNWGEAVDVTLSQSGDQATLVFSRPSEPVDLGRIRTDAPKFLTAIDQAIGETTTTFTIGLDGGAQTRVWQDGYRHVLDLSADTQSGEPVLDALASLAPPPPPPPKAEPKADEPKTALARPDPVPASGEVRVGAAPLGSSLELTFPWAAPVAAAAFRRGDWIWLIFDAEAEFDLAALRLGHRQIRSVEARQGAGWSAVRILSPTTIQVEARLDLVDQWSFVLGERLAQPPEPIPLRADAGSGRDARLTAWFDGYSVIRQVKDPVVGDALWVALLDGPPRGAPAQRDYAGFAMLATAQGLAAELYADSLAMTAIPQGVAVGGRGGLALTPTLAARSEARTAWPGFIDTLAWAGVEPFEEAYQRELRDAAANNDDPEAQVKLAQFLIGHGLAAEALGVLANARALDPALGGDPAFRAMRGVARLSLGRNEAAMRDLDSPRLAADPAAALWRGLYHVHEEDWRSARNAFEQGKEVLYLHGPRERALFQSGLAKAALALNDTAMAKDAIEQALAEDVDREIRERARLLKAQYDEALGETEAAHDAYRLLVDTASEPVRAEAMYHDIRLAQAMGRLSAPDAIEALESLRFRWRGDDTELSVVHELGQLYIGQGDYSRGLATLRSAARQFPDRPGTRAVVDTMSKTFRDLFLKGDADALEPIEALGLYYEFQDLTPINADGDRMIRRLTDRLVSFDLLDPATELLQYQIDNRLEGVGRAQVAADLAAIYLMDRNAEAAFRVLRSTRFAGLSDALVAERRLLEARALVELGRHDHALELIAFDRSREAMQLRADVAWTAKDWAKAGPALAATLGAPQGAGLDPATQTDALRAAISYSLANDQSALDALAERWTPVMDRGPHAEAFRLVASGLDARGVRLRDIAAQVADADGLDRFLDEYRNRFAESSGS
ncbi:MAG: tetratricopeptide repeat protein [Maricaulaceae bacterium]